MHKNLSSLVELLGEKLVARKMMVVVAESCTGGGLAKALTSVPESGQWFERGFVTYSVKSKKELLGVSDETIDLHGVVSEQTAAEMVRGALSNSRTQIGAAITGLAGPDNGGEKKPVGTVCFAWCMENVCTITKTFVFAGDRESVCEQSIMAAIEGLLDLTDHEDYHTTHTQRTQEITASSR